MKQKEQVTFDRKEKKISKNMKSLEKIMQTSTSRSENFWSENRYGCILMVLHSQKRSWKYSIWYNNNNSWLYIKIPGIW